MSNCDNFDILVIQTVCSWLSKDGLVFPPNLFAATTLPWRTVDPDNYAIVSQKHVSSSLIIILGKLIVRIIGKRFHFIAIQYELYSWTLSYGCYGRSDILLVTACSS